MDQPSQVVDELAEMLAARRRGRITRQASYVALADAILAEEPEATKVEQATRAA